MGFEFRSCDFEMDYEAYIRFLLQHHARLNLPYPFSMKLAFIGSPLEFGKAMLIFEEETHDIVGAAGIVYGTGANDYEDRHVCQVEIAFIQDQFRSTLLFVRAMKALIDTMKKSNPDVKQIQFWAHADNKELQPLISRWSKLPGYHESVVNNLKLYKIPFDELDAYCLRFDAAYKLAQ